jgi:hypothetical protein
MSAKASNTKDAVLFGLLIILGAAVFIGDLHKIILRAVWPYLVTFYDTFIGIYGA